MDVDDFGSLSFLQCRKLKLPTSMNILMGKMTYTTYTTFNAFNL